MAKTKVLTITVQNKPGAVAAVAKALGSAKVNILALLGTAQGAAGTVYFVVEDAKRAKKVLDEAKLAYQETGSKRKKLANTYGALAKHLEKLAANGVNLGSIYATAVQGGKKAVVVYTAEVQAEASEPEAAGPAA